MQSDKPQLFNDTVCVSKEQLLLYSQNKLSAAERHNVELHLTDCELCSDALEGLALLTSYDVLNKVAEEVDQKYAIKEKSVSVYRNNTMWYAAASVLLAVFSFWMINSYIAGNHNQVAESKEEKTVGLPVEKPQINSDHIVSDTLPASAMVAAPPPVLQQQARVSKNTADVVQQPEKEEAVTLNESAGNATATRNVAYDMPAPAAASEVAEDKKEILSSVAKKSEDKSADKFKARGDDSNISTTLNLSGYKVYNYNEEYSPIERERKKLNDEGVPAKYDSQKDMEKAATWNSIKVKEVSYDDFLSGALLDYKQKKYSSAINKFQLILTDHPQDVNAVFYSALAYEESGNTEQALKMLDKLEKIPNKTFDQEAEWHKALVLLQAGEQRQATHLLEKISKAGGFYANQAAVKLSGLKQEK